MQPSYIGNLAIKDGVITFVALEDDMALTSATLVISSSATASIVSELSNHKRGMPARGEFSAALCLHWSRRMNTKRPSSAPRFYRSRPCQMLLILGALLFSATSAMAQKPAPARTKSAAVTRTAQIEVVESQRKSKIRHAASMTVSLLGDGVPSRLETHIAGAEYRIVVNQRVGAGVHTTELSVKSSQRSGGHTILNVDARAVTPLGKRIVVSRVVNPDGTQFEIAVTLR